MTICQAQSTAALHQFKELALHDLAFTVALLATKTTQEAVQLATSP